MLIGRDGGMVRLTTCLESWIQTHAAVDNDTRSVDVVRLIGGQAVIHHRQSFFRSHVESFLQLGITKIDSGGLVSSLAGVFGRNGISQPSLAIMQSHPAISGTLILQAEDNF